MFNGYIAWTHLHCLGWCGWHNYNTMTYVKLVLCLANVIMMLSFLELLECSLLYIQLIQFDSIQLLYGQWSWWYYYNVVCIHTNFDHAQTFTPTFIRTGSTCDKHIPKSRRQNSVYSYNVMVISSWSLSIYYFHFNCVKRDYSLMCLCTEYCT